MLQQVCEDRQSATWHTLTTSTARRTSIRLRLLTSHHTRLQNHGRYLQGQASWTAALSLASRPRPRRPWLPRRQPYHSHLKPLPPTLTSSSTTSRRGTQCTMPTRSWGRRAGFTTATKRANTSFPTMLSALVMGRLTWPGRLSLRLPNRPEKMAPG